MANNNAEQFERLAAAQREHAARRAAPSAPSASNPFAAKPVALGAGASGEARLVAGIETASLILLSFNADERETFVRALNALLPRWPVEERLAELAERFLAGMEANREEERTSRERWAARDARDATRDETAKP